MFERGHLKSGTVVPLHWISIVGRSVGHPLRECEKIDSGIHFLQSIENRFGRLLQELVSFGFESSDTQQSTTHANILTSSYHELNPVRFINENADTSSVLPARPTSLVP